MATLTVTQDDLTSAVTFLEQFLSVNMPQYDFSEGTANRDIAINSMAYVVAFIRGEVANVKAQQSLLKLGSVSPDDSVDEVVDEILSNWFVQRKSGRKAKGYATFRFSRDDIGVVIIKKDDVFTRSGKDFNVNTPADTYTIQTTDLTRNVDNLGVVYFTVSVPLIASDVGNDYEVAPGLFESFPALSPYLTKVENLTRFLGGEAQETSSDMIARSESAITQRTLDTEPAIQTVLSNTFDQVLGVTAIGMGDPEMLRDQLEITRGSGESIIIHRGSKMDAYLKLPVEFDLSYADTFPSTGGLEAVVATVGDVSITGVKLPSFPVYKIRGLKDRSVTPAADVPFTVMTDAPEFWNSDRQNTYLSVSSDHLGQFLDLQYDGVTGYADVQTYVADRRNRVLVGDLLTKASFALYLKFELRYYPSSSNAIDVTTAQLSLQDFIHGHTLGAQFLVSDILDKFTSDNPGNRPQLPFVVVGELLLPNGLSLTINFEDRIEAPERYAFSQLTPTELTPLFAGDVDPAGMTIVRLSDLQVSARTLRYVVDTLDITLTAIS